MINFLKQKIILKASSVFLGSFLLLPALAMDELREQPFSQAACVSTLKTQADVNAIVARVAQETYGKINDNWTYVLSDAGSEMTTDSTFWEPQYVKGMAMMGDKKVATKIPSLILKTSPEHLIEALEDLISKPAQLECTIALKTVQILCLKELLGKDLFTVFATAFYKVLGDHQNWTIEEFFHELPLQFLTPEEGSATFGSIFYITNIPQYAKFKPNGNSRGENVFCVNPDKFIGFGESYKKGPLALNEIQADLFNSFILENDVKQEDMTNFRKIIQLLTKNPEVCSHAFAQAQANYNFYTFFNLKEIQSFLNTGEIYI